MGREHLFLVEDEEDILELLRYNLSRQGYDISTATTGEEALRLIPKCSPDLILLDLMLSGIDGLEVCRTLKGHPTTRQIPILILTAKGEETDIVTGLELGADDYVTKPFSMKVLIARVRAALRRNDGEDTVGDQPVRIHTLVLDPARHLVTVEKQPVDLTTSEFSLLQFLVSKPGWVFTRNQIIDAIRGDGYAVTDRAVDVQVVGLRKKLGDAEKYIETVRGVGYRFKE